MKIHTGENVSYVVRLSENFVRLSHTINTVEQPNIYTEQKKKPNITQLNFSSREPKSYS